MLLACMYTNDAKWWKNVFMQNKITFYNRKSVQSICSEDIFELPSLPHEISNAIA